MVAIHDVTQDGITVRFKVYGSSEVLSLPHNDTEDPTEVIFHPHSLLDKQTCEQLNIPYTTSAIFNYLRKHDYLRSITGVGSRGADLSDTLRPKTFENPLEQVVHYFSNELSDTGFLLIEQEEEQPSRRFHSVGYDAGFYLPDPEEVPSKANLWETKHNYSYGMDKDRFNFFRKVGQEDAPFFGLELELSTRLSVKELQAIVTDVHPKQEPFFIGKDDSSIGGKYENNVELVTVPCTPRYLRAEWRKFFNKIETLCQKKGKTLSDYFDTSSELSNGIHIHVGRDNFEGGGRGPHIKRFSTLMNLNDRFSRELFRSVSKRPDLDGQYCRVSDFHKGRLTSWRLANCLNDDTRGRVNLGSRHGTVEVRMFQGIVDADHVLECIDFTEAAVDYSAMCSISSLGRRFSSFFKEYVLKSGKYRNLQKAFS